MPFQNTTLEHFDIIKKIGDGSYSKVFQAKARGMLLSIA